MSTKLTTIFLDVMYPFSKAGANVAIIAMFLYGDLLLYFPLYLIR